MKRLIVLMIASMLVAGCIVTPVKNGVSASYDGVKTVSSDVVGAVVGGVSAVMSGGSMTFSFETDAAYNNEEVTE